MECIANRFSTIPYTLFYITSHLFQDKHILCHDSIVVTAFKRLSRRHILFFFHRLSSFSNWDLCLGQLEVCSYDSTLYLKQFQSDKQAAQAIEHRGSLNIELVLPIHATHFPFGHCIAYKSVLSTTSNTM